jgi:hypothetical protein
VAPRRKKKREPGVLKEFSLKFQGLDMYIYVLDNDEWLIECEKGVKDISIFGDVRSYAEAEGFVDDLS